MVQEDGERGYEELCEDFCFENWHKELEGEVEHGSVVECLPSMQKVLVPSPVPQTNKTKDKSYPNILSLPSVFVRNYPYSIDGYRLESPEPDSAKTTAILR